MFIDYRTLVFQDYQQKKLANTISVNLIQPTPARIRAACMETCQSRYNRKDTGSLALFFGPYEDQAGLLKAMTRFETDKFKPFVKYLKGETSEPDVKIIELLAWLIDFAQRPYEFGKKYDTEIVSDIVKDGDDKLNTKVNASSFEPETKQEDVEKIDDFSSDEEQPVKENISSLYVDAPQVMNTNALPVVHTSPGNNNRKKFNFKKASVVAVVLSMFLVVGGYWQWHKRDREILVPYGSSVKFNNLNKITEPDTITKKITRLPTKKEAVVYSTSTGQQDMCMYWADDHYRLIPCEQKYNDKNLIPFDAEKFKNFKRITTPDTITKKAKGYVWYTTINKEKEFYTSDGYHPIDTSKRLKPITDYIIKEYIDAKKEQ